MLVLASLVSAALLGLPQDQGKTVPATPIKPATVAAPAAPQAPIKKLGVGDPAPALQYDAWVKGDKVTGIEKGKVHVIEFWATWCGPCIAVMPHLSEIQKKNPSVIVVSVAASERGKDESSMLEKVKTFVEGKGDTMGYRIVFASDREKMSKPWMQAAGQNGIPCSFIVDKDSNIAWIGHPATMDAPLAQVLAGTWDAAAAKKLFEEERAAEEEQNKLRTTMRDAMKSGDYGPAIDAMKASLAKVPNDALKMELMRILAGPAGKPNEAWKYGEELLESGKNNEMMMNQLAWTIVDPEGGVEKPNLELARKAAEAGMKAGKGENGALLDTFARVLFLKGEVARAIETQKKAIEKAADGPMKDEMKTTLAEYEGALKKA